MAGSFRKSGPPLILIVDDDPIMTRALSSLLQGTGFETACVHDIAGAEDVLRSREVSVILLDVFLPDGNGLDFCARVTGNPAGAGVPILFISASDDVAVKVKGFASGAVDYLTKPFAGAEVLARVRTHLRLRAAYEALVEFEADRIQRLAASQQSLMPQPDDVPEARFQICLQQAQKAGGDFYDVIVSGNRIIDYVVADASGHDPGVSLWTASLKALLAEYAAVVHTPTEICRMMNNSLKRILPVGIFFTLVYARLNRASRKLTLVNAGHPPVFVYRSKTNETEVFLQDGDVMGVFSDAAFGVLEIPVTPGDRLFLYTDGLVERDGTRDQGLRAVREAAVQTAGFPLQEAVPSIVSRVGGERDLEDDVVLLGIDV